MNITIRLNDGKEVSLLHSTYSAKEIETKMNDQQVTAIAIGDSVFAKYSITYVVPTGSLTTPVSLEEKTGAEAV